MRQRPLSPAVLFPSERIELLHGDAGEEEMDTYTSFDSLMSLHYHETDIEEVMQRHPSQTVVAACSTSGRKADATPASERWRNTGHRTDLLHHRKIVLRRPAYVPPLIVHLDRKLPMSLSPEVLSSWRRPVNGLTSHRIEMPGESEDIPNRGKRRKKRYRMTVSKTSSLDLFSTAESHTASSTMPTAVFMETHDTSWMFLHYISDGWPDFRTAALYRVSHQRNLLTASLSLEDASGGISLVVSRKSRLEWKPSQDSRLPLEFGSLPGAHLWLDPVKLSRNQSSAELKISLMLAKPSALVVDLTLLAGKRHDRRDERSGFELRQLLERSQKVHPQLLICTSSRTFRSFVQDLWSDKKHCLPTPDIMLLAGGSQIAYQTPAGWSMDESWSNRLSSRSWDRASVERAALRMMDIVSQQGQAQQRESGGQLARVKVDTIKQQCPLRLRLLTNDATSVVRVLEQCLKDEAQASELQWEVRVQEHVEGGGAAHRGWSAIDVVPHRGGLDQALAYVLSRFQIQAETVAGVLDASSGLGATHASSTVSCSSGSPHKHDSFGLGLVVVGKEQRPSSRAFGPGSILDGLKSLGLLPETAQTC
jgi:hypothetical protein